MLCMWVISFYLGNLTIFGIIINDENHKKELVYI